MMVAMVWEYSCSRATSIAQATQENSKVSAKARRSKVKRLLIINGGIPHITNTTSLSPTQTAPETRHHIIYAATSKQAKKNKTGSLMT